MPRWIRIPFTVTAQMLKDIERLGKVWNLDRSNTLRHCVARCVKEEFGEKEKPPGPHGHGH